MVWGNETQQVISRGKDASEGQLAVSWVNADDILVRLEVDNLLLDYVTD